MTLSQRMRNLLSMLRKYWSIELLFVVVACFAYIVYKTYSYWPPVIEWYKETLTGPIFGVDSPDREMTRYFRMLGWFTMGFFTLFLLPFLFTLIVHRGKVFKMTGLQFSKPKIGFALTIPALVIMIGAVIGVLLIFPDMFMDQYPFAKITRMAWTYLLWYEIAYFSYFFTWEFFFHGFLLFPFEEKFGRWGAVLIGLMPFVIVHLGKPLPETLGSIIAGVFLSILALETRSFLHGFLLHAVVAVSMDVAAVMLFRMGG